MKWLGRWWPVLAPTLLALACVPLRGVNGLPDTGWYLAAALNLAEGRGLTETDGSAIVVRGPVFPGLLALAFSFLGTSVLHALWVVRVFLVASIALISWLGLRLFSPWAGLAAGLLALTAVRIQEWYAVILLDGVVTVLLLLTVALVYEASGGDRPLRWYAAAGAVLGAALLTKEVAIVLLPLPLLALILSRRWSRIHLLGSGLFALVALLVVLPWAIHVWNVSGSLGGLLGGGEQVASRAAASGEGGGLAVIAGQYLAVAGRFHDRYVSAPFVLAPLWLVSWLWLGGRVLVRPSPAGAVVAGAALLFGPVALVTAKNGLRAGQVLFLYQLSCVAVGALLGGLATGLARRASPRGSRRAGTALWGAALLAAVLAPQVLDQGFRRWVQGNPVGHAHGLALGSEGRFARKGWVARHIERAASRIQEEVPADAVIMSDWHWRASLFFFAGGSHVFAEIPYRSVPPEWPPRAYAEATLQEGEKPLFLFTRRDVGDDLDTSLLVFTQSEIMAEMERWNARWVVVTHRRPFLALFFDAHPDFAERARLSGGRIRLYEKTGNGWLSSFEMRVGTSTAQWLDTMRAERPRAAEAIELTLMEEAGLTREDLGRLGEGGFETVTTSPGY